MAAATVTPLPVLTPALALGGIAQGPFEPGQMFGGRYRILKMLGAGGMGVVYQAWDQALELAVALKVIRPDATSDPDVLQEIERRFKRELLLARQVTHRNVVRIHDFGEVDGIKYISMPFVEGRDLATVLAETDRLPVAHAIQIVKQVAAGLAAAHEAGIVHRDLKPENVMIDPDGRALIMDFGISRSVGTGATTAGLTTAGAIVGTLQYMAPEQAQGAPVDHRADIYALGLMFYDMLGGRARMQRQTSPVSEMMSRITEPPPPLRTVAPDTPVEIDRIVARALEPDPAKRYQHVNDFVSELDGYERGPIAVAPQARARLWRVVAIAAAILWVTALAGWWFTRERTSPTPLARQPVSVLIADFDNKTGDAVFQGAVEQALGIGLEGASFVSTYPRRDAIRAAAQIAPNSPLNENVARLVARREGVTVVLAGAVEAADLGYRIRVRAIDAVSDGRELAAREVRANSKAEVLNAVGTLAAGIRKALGDTTIEADTLSTRETFTAGSLEAAREYSLAQELSNAGKDEEAITHYEGAIARDPKFGRAYSGLASIEARLGRADAARQHFERAISLADVMTDREKLRTQGAYHAQIRGDYEQAISIYTELVNRFPADFSAHNNLAVAYFNTRNFQRALDEGRKALEVLPKSVVYRYNYALFAMYAGDFETAEREAKAALALNPATPKAYLALAMANLARGNTAGAAAAYRDAQKAGARGASLAAIGLADIQLYEGQTETAIATLRQGIAADMAANATVAAAAKQLALADASLSLGRKPEATAAVTAALASAHTPSVAVPASEILIALGREREAAALADELRAGFSRHEKASAQAIDARLLLARGRPKEAVGALREATQSDDYWLVRFALGVAYVEAGLAPSALAELEQCERRIGEMTAVFLDDVPSYRYKVRLLYWKARAQQAMKQASAPRTFEEFLSRRPAGAVDPMTIDARQRVRSIGR